MCQGFVFLIYFREYQQKRSEKALIIIFMRCLNLSFDITTETVASRYFVKKCLKNFLKTHYKTPVPITLKKRRQHRYFPVNFAKFLKAPFP